MLWILVEFREGEAPFEAEFYAHGLYCLQLLISGLA